VSSGEQWRTAELRWDAILVPKGLVLAPLMPGYTFLVSLRRSHFVSTMTEIPPEPILDPYSLTRTQVMKVSLIMVSSCQVWPIAARGSQDLVRNPN